MKNIAWDDLENILQKVEKPGRYLGGEWNSAKKDPEKVAVKVALAFPDVYEIGMSYLGQKILYQILNSQPHILAERVFAPWLDLERELRVRGIPLFSLENRIPLERFHIIGFSLLYELNYSNVLTMLDLGRIPLFSKNRNLGHPLIVSGGPAVFNPEPIADFCDLFVIGDGEEVFLELIQKYMALRDELANKKDILAELANIDGIYVPSMYVPKKTPLVVVEPKPGMPARIKKRVLFRFREAPFPEDIVVPHIQVVFDRVAWEVARGCPQKCRFCQASSIYFPHRVKSPSSVIGGILRSLRSTGYESVSLSSLSVSDYPYLEEVVRSLMGELEKQNVSLSLSSLRPKGLTPKVVGNIVRVRKTGFTLVPEAGTERLRAVINKCLKNDEIGAAAESAFAEGWKRLKLYFMIGLPTETDEDLLGIVRTVEEIHRLGRKILKRSPQISLSVSSFIPKSHTPFQWLPMEDEQVLDEKFRFLLRRLKKFRSVRLKRDPLRRSILEGVYSRGDRKLNSVLHSAWQEGARFDSWDETFQFRFWEKAFESEHLDYRAYLSELDKKSILPWDHIETGLTKDHLLEELELALNGKSSPPCSERKCSVCKGCAYPPPSLERRDDDFDLDGKDSPILGKRTEEVHRYRAYFSKRSPARYLSHMDMSSIIQQGLRRAGIRVDYSQGFHPKMLISHPPALPLGMEGKEEWLEFKSSYVFSEEEFLTHINSYLIEGLEFFRLSRLDEAELSMNKKTTAFVYSLDLGDDKVIEAVQKRCLGNKTEEDYLILVNRCIDGYLEGRSDDAFDRIYVDEEEKKLYLVIKNIPQKGEKPQEIVSSVFGMVNPVYSMARERFLVDHPVES